MLLVVSNLPPGTTADHLGRLMDLGRTPVRIFRKPDRVGSAQRYALFDVKPERAGRRLLRRRYRLDDQPLSLRPYQTRSVANERRALGWRERAWGMIERRAGERRNPQHAMTPELHLSAQSPVPA
jgi:hypothetical protein